MLASAAAPQRPARGASIGAVSPPGPRTARRPPPRRRHRADPGRAAAARARGPGRRALPSGPAARERRQHAPQAAGRPAEVPQRLVEVLGRADVDRGADGDRIQARGAGGRRERVRGEVDEVLARAQMGPAGAEAAPLVGGEVRHLDDDVAAGPRPAGERAQKGAAVGNVLEHMEGADDIKAALGQPGGLQFGDDDRQPAGPRHLRRGALGLDALHAPAPRARRGQQLPGPGADVQPVPAAHAGGPLDDPHPTIGDPPQVVLKGRRADVEPERPPPGRTCTRRRRPRRDRRTRAPRPCRSPRSAAAARPPPPQTPAASPNRRPGRWAARGPSSRARV